SGATGVPGTARPAGPCALPGASATPRPPGAGKAYGAPAPPDPPKQPLGTKKRHYPTPATPASAGPQGRRTGLRAGTKATGKRHTPTRRPGRSHRPCPTPRSRATTGGSETRPGAVRRSTYRGSSPPAPRLDLA